MQNDKNSFLETKHGTGFVHWNLEYLDLFRVWGFVFRISDFPVCFVFRASSLQGEHFEFYNNINAANPDPTLISPRSRP